MQLAAPGPCGVRLHLAASGLDRKDSGGLGKSDPFLCIYNDNGQILTKEGPRPRVLYRTEVIPNVLDPTWEPFILYFDECGGPGAKLILECFDYDEDDNVDLIGELRTTVAELLKKPTSLVFKHPRKKGPFYKHSGKLVVKSAAEVAANQRDPKTLPGVPAYSVTFSGKSLERKDLLSSDPFLKIFALKQPDPIAMGFGMPGAPPAKAKAKKTTKPKYVLIAKSEVIKSNLNPKWAPIRLDVAECGGMEGKIRVECWDYDSNNTHDYIAQCWTTLREMLWAKPMWNLINPSKAGGVAYRNSGTLHVSDIKVENTPKTVSSAYKLSFKASNLDRKDISGKSDPYFVIKACPKPQWSYPYCTDPDREAAARGKKKKGTEAKFVQVYRSEVIHRNLNPTWMEMQINVADVGGMDGVLNFDVFDWDQRGVDDLIGTCSSTLRELLMPGATFALKNKANILSSNSGVFIFDKITPAVSKFTTPPYGFKIKIRAEKIERKDLGGLGASDPFLVINGRPYSQPKDVPIHKTEVVRTTTSPQWAEFTLEIAKCGGLDSNIKIECWDHDDGKKPDFIGAVVTTIRELMNFKDVPKLKLINPAKKGRVGYTDSGIIVFDTLTAVDPPPSFNPLATMQFKPVDWNAPAGFAFDTMALNLRMGMAGPGGSPGIAQSAPSGYGAPGGPGGSPGMAQSAPSGYGAPGGPGSPGHPGAYPGAGFAPPGQQGWGAPPPGQAPPGQQGWGAPPGQAPPGQQGWGAPPGQQGWGAPPPGQAPPDHSQAPGQPGAPPANQPPYGGYGAPYGAPGPYGTQAPGPYGTQAPGYGYPPQQQGWGAPPGQAPPGQQGWGSPPPAQGDHSQAPPGQTPPGQAPPAQGQLPV